MENYTAKNALQKLSKLTMFKVQTTLKMMSGHSVRSTANSTGTSTRTCPSLHSTEQNSLVRDLIRIYISFYKDTQEEDD